MLVSGLYFSLDTICSFNKLEHTKVTNKVAAMKVLCCMLFHVKHDFDSDSQNGMKVCVLLLA